MECPSTPHLCSIYAQDLLQFLPRKDVEKVKLVSSNMYEAVVGASWKLPRSSFYQLRMVGNRF